MLSIKLNVIGKIVKGDNPGWHLKIKDDTESSGGFYIIQFKNKCGKNQMGEAFDDWVETLKDVESYFDSEEEEWEVIWEEE